MTTNYPDEGNHEVKVGSDYAYKTEYIIIKMHIRNSLQGYEAKVRKHGCQKASHSLAIRIRNVDEIWYYCRHMQLLLYIDTSKDFIYNFTGHKRMIFFCLTIYCPKFFCRRSMSGKIEKIMRIIFHVELLLQNHLLQSELALKIFLALWL